MGEPKAEICAGKTRVYLAKVFFNFPVYYAVCYLVILQILLGGLGVGWGGVVHSKKLKEHLENASDLNERNVMLDIFTDMDWITCCEEKDATWFDENGNDQQGVEFKNTQ